MAEELNSLLQKTLQQIVSHCTETAKKVEQTQSDFASSLDNLDRKIGVVSGLVTSLDNSKVREASVELEKYKNRFTRLQERAGLIQARISSIELSFS